MKKITLIACVALVAGLLVSCNNATEAGTIDYNNVRKTSNVNSYAVSGKLTTTEYVEDDEFDASNKQTSGTKSTNVNTLRIISAAALVAYNTDSVNETNSQEYTISFDSSDGKRSGSSESSTWSSSGWGSPSKSTTEEASGDPADFIRSDEFDVFFVDGVVYYENQYGVFAGEADEEAMAAGEDFTLKLTYTLDKPTAHGANTDVTPYNTNGQQIAGRTVNVTYKTYTYDLTFTAK